MKTKRLLIHICLLWVSLMVNVTRIQAGLTNGANLYGTILPNVTDSYTFMANTGDSINLRLGTTGFEGKLQLYGPNGALLTSFGTSHDIDDPISYTATTNGTFTVLVSSINSGDSGTYVLRLAQIPEPFIVPSGDEGGAITNGLNHTGNLTLADMDMWTFTANVGDAINLRLGTTNFSGKLQVYGPDGTLLKTIGANESMDDQGSFTATNNGTFTVLVSDFNREETGTYVLRLAQIPEPFIVPSDDEGGPLTNGVNHTGTITLADMDMWTFTAFKGGLIKLELTTTNFSGKLQLYGANGSLLKTVGSNGSTDDPYGFTATNSGIFTVLVSDFNGGETGIYGLTATGISSGLKISKLTVSGTNFILNGVGGTSNSLVILYSTTNLATPLRLWTPVQTNFFDQFGMLTTTNIYNTAAQKQGYFRFIAP